MIETGKVLQNRYRIDKQIGQGGMGAVYVATDERFNSVVAIKETLCMDDNFRKALEREARLLNSLKHSALPRVSDHFIEENGQYLVMEYIPGEDLFCMMERGQKTFPTEQVLTWADQLLDALDFLHNQQIPVIHRDIKPQNLKIASHGQIILLDFGLAKGNPTDAGHQTAAKSIFGYTRNYASLEQIQGTGTDPRSDLYSLAATLYHLLTGAPPEDALTRAMSVLSHKPDPLVPACAVRPEIPKGVAGVLHKALDLNADQRPEFAGDMRQMLRESDNYATFAENAQAARTGTSPDIFAQETKLVPGDTRQDGGWSTDVKTEILPGYDSQETSVRGASTRANTGGAAVGLLSADGAASPGSRWRVRLAMAAIGGLLMAGSVAGGIYLYNSSLTAQSEQENVTEEQPFVTVQEITEESANAAEADVAANASEPGSADAGALTTKTEDAEAKAKTADTRRATRAEGDHPETRAGDVRIEGNTVHVGNMKITDGKIETPDSYIDETGIRRKIPPAFPGGRPMSPEEFRALTPAQRRKLRAVWRQHELQKRRQQQTPPNPPDPY